MDKEKVGLLGMRLQKLGGWGEHNGGHGFCRSELRHGCKWYKVTNPKASLKAHDYHVLCGMVGQWAFDGLYKHPYEKVVQQVLEAMGNMLVKDVPSIEHEKSITTGVIRAVALLEAMFPSILLDHKWHQLLHIASDLPTWVNSMWAYERFNRFLLGRIANKAHPEASLAEHYKCFQAVMLKKLHDSSTENDVSAIGRQLGLEREYDPLVFPSRWFAGTKMGDITLTGGSTTRELEEDHDADIIIGLHQFYLDCLVTQPNGEFVSMEGTGLNRYMQHTN